MTDEADKDIGIGDSINKGVADKYRNYLNGFRMIKNKIDLN